MGHPDEARKTAARSPRNRDGRTTSDKKRENSRRELSPPPPPAPAATPAGERCAPASDPGLRIERKTEPEAKRLHPRLAPATRTDPPSVADRAAAVFAISTKVYSMVGTITDVNCAGAPQIQVTLKSHERSP